jgi:hypothetical protein
MIYVEEGKKVCPKCNDLKILDKIEGSKYSQKLQEFVRKQFLDGLKESNKYDLINVIALERENYSNILLLSRQYNSISLNIIFNFTFIISELINFGKEIKNGRKINEESIKQIFEASEKIVEVEMAHVRVKAGYSSVILLKNCPLDQVNMSESNKDFNICENENYGNIRKSYKINRIFTEREAKRIVEETRNKLGKYETDYEDFTAEEFISSCYEIIISLYGGLIRSGLHAEVFDIRNFKEIFKDPAELM